MLSRAVFLRSKKDQKKHRSLPRFYVDVEFCGLNPDFNYCLLEFEVPIHLKHYKVAYDARPTLSHFLVDKKFPALLGFDLITCQRTTKYDGIMEELFKESIHSLRHNQVSFLLSALRWPTGIPTLEFIDYYFGDFIFLSSADTKSIGRILKLLIKASGYYSGPIEDQVVEIHRKTLLEGEKYGLTKRDLPGNDIIGEICVVQAARVAKLALKQAAKDPNSVLPKIYCSLSPQVSTVVKSNSKGQEFWVNATADESMSRLLREDESFRITYLSTVWAKDWPLPRESSSFKKSAADNTRWLPRSPLDLPL
ncbi:nonstructural protein [Kiborgoch virus]|uniref:Nonstructural protein n=1 Tax=Kiborgoch virus TaxID=2767009 RepID=A0A7G8PYK5_9VIRU|nr:nonstructural protein [Kiborgoch virus]QNJ99611.1 nonstructural protein [Kiborgoch virus]